MAKKNVSPLQGLAYLTQLGLTMVIPIIGGILLGNFLDEKFSTGYLFLMIGVVIGVLAAFRNLFMIGNRSANKKGNHKNEE